MNKMNISAIFCEDVREEKLGPVTLVGILSDNLEVPQFPSAIPKLGIYVRIGMDPDLSPTGGIRLILTDVMGQKTIVNEISQELLVESLERAREQANPVAGVYSTMMASPFPLPKPGRVVLDAEYAGEAQTLAIVNFNPLSADEAIS